MEYREARAQKHQPVHPFSRVPTKWAPIERLFKVSKGTRESSFGIFYSVNPCTKGSDNEALVIMQGLRTLKV